MHRSNLAARAAIGLASTILFSAAGAAQSATTPASPGSVPSLPSTAGCPPGTTLQAVQVRSDMTAAQAPPWQNLPLSVPKFVAGPGEVLIAAKVTVRGEVTGSIQAHNLGPAPQNPTTTLSSNLVFNSQIPGFTNVPLVGLGVQFTDNLAAFDGPPINFLPPDGITHANLFDDDSSSIRITDPAVLASLFTGPGTLTVLTSAADSSGSNGPGNLALVFLNTSQAFLEVEYSYCTNTPPTANDDTAQVCSGGTVDIPVLVNDVDPNGGIINCNSLTITQQPQHGTATVISGCSAGQPCPGVCVQYVSTDPTFTGNDTFVYRITDNIGRIDTATVTVSVCKTNALDDTGVVCTGGTVSVPVLQNDSTSCGAIDCASLVITSQPLHGTVTIDTSCTAGAPCPGTCLKYTSTDPTFSGSDTFSYRVGNTLQPACLDTASVTITVCRTVALDDAATVCAGGNVSIPVTANDSTTCGTINCATLTITAPPANGTAQVSGCNVTYTPNPGYFGPDNFAYSVGNSGSPVCSDPATVAVTVCRTDAVDDTAVVCSGGSVTVPVTANDTTSCGTIACGTLAITTPPQHGTAQIQGCSIVYTATAGYQGPDSFGYSVGNGQAPVCTDAATVSLNVCLTVANNDSATVCAGSSVTIPVTANDTATCGTLNCASILVTAQPLHGSVQVQGCNLVYTPAAGYSGPDQFGYSIANGGTPVCVDDALVTLNVCSTNAPDLALTVCSGNNLPVTIQATTTCGAISCGSLVVLTPPANGTVQPGGACTLVYTPNPGYAGPDSFSYRIGNDQTPSCTDAGTVSINVCRTTAVDDAATVCAGASATVPVTANDTTTCGTINCATLTITTPPANGTAQVSGCGIVYTPNAGFTGADSLVYTVGNNQQPVCTDPATVSFTVCATNAVDDSITVCGGGAVTVPVTANDTTSCGTISCASLTITTPPAHGTAVVSGCNVLYTAAAGYSGPDSFTYQVGNNQTPACLDQGVVSVNVCSVDAVNDSRTLCAGSSATIPVTANDTTTCGALNCATLAILQQPLHGTVQIQGCNVVYTPTAGYTGPDSFQYVVANNQSPPCRDRATVTLTVCATDAVNDLAVVCSGSNVSIPVTANDTTTCGAISCATLAVTTPPQHGTAVVQGCNVLYTPAAGYVGPDAFAYTVGNNQTPACTDTGSVSVTVCATNALDDSATVCSGESVTVPVTANDTTSCGTVACATLTITTPPQHGTAQVQGCSIVYTANSGYQGPDTVGYSVGNSQAPVCTDTATVSFSVCLTVANDDSAQVCTGSSVTVTVTANDLATCGTLDCATLHVTTPPLHGTAQVQGCTIVYTPTAGYSGPDTLVYQIGNNQAPVCTDTATVAFDVCTVTAGDDAASLCTGGDVLIPLTANDSAGCGQLSCASIAITSPPAHGSVVLEGCAARYTPAPGYVGPDSFGYQVSNGLTPSCSDTALVTIDVDPLPVAQDDKAIKDPASDDPIDIDVLANDSAGDGCTLDTASVTITVPPLHGVVLGVDPADGSVLYDPNPGFPGHDSFTYQVTNSCGCTDTAVVDVNQPEPCPERNRRVCGSLLLYPEFDNRPGRLTLLAVTEACCDGSPGTKVEFRFIRKDNCLKTDTTFHLTTCDGLSLITKNVNSGGPNARGYAYVYAKGPANAANPTGVPIVHNRLVGQQLVLDGITAGNYSMNAVAFRGLGDEGAPNDDDADGIRDLNGPTLGDGSPNLLAEYEEAPDEILIPRFVGQDAEWDSEMILVALSGGAQFTTIVGILGYNDNEEPFSAQYEFYCWDKPKLRDFASFTLESFLLNGTAHDPNEVEGWTEETGWLRIDGLQANSEGPESILDPAVYAVLVECRNGRCGASLPFERCTQTNGDLLPVHLYGDGPNPHPGDDQ